MADPGDPTSPEPDPDQPGWASPTPPPPPAPVPPPPPEPTPVAPTPAPAPTRASSPAWGTQPPAWGTPPPSGAVPPVPPTAPGPPAAPGGGWVPPTAAPKKRRLTWLWILIPTLLILVASTIVVIVFAVRLITGPVETTNDYYADLRDGSYASAYGELCAPLRDRITQSSFIDLQRSDTQSKGRVTSFDFNSSDVHKDTAFVSGTVDRGGSTYDARVGLRKEGDDWKVCAVRER